MKIPKIINKSRFYLFEHTKYTKERMIYLTRIEAKRFTRKIAKHFKVNVPIIKFHARRNRFSGHGDWEKNVIRVNPNPQVLVLSHELAHIIAKSGHSKKTLAILDKIIQFARKKNYWLKKVVSE